MTGLQMRLSKGDSIPQKLDYPVQEIALKIGTSTGNGSA